MIHEYGAALIEEFVEGREFTALVAEARGADEDAWVLEPVEFRFPAGETFKHFDLKWKDYAEMRAQPVAESGLADRLRAVAALTFAALGGSGFGRCDLRVDDTGEIYLLEINPNCGMFYPEGEFGSADFILAADPAGHRGFLLHLIECALRRRDRGVRVWRMEFTPERGFGLYAAQPLQAGDVVVRYEERAQRLVSKRYAERHWRGLHRDWFDRYAWPLAGDVYGIWSEDPGDWRPINHGCDPNTWLDGLDLVARRNIAEGEHLTVDYATFCGPGMKSFPCVCGAGICRNVICGTDCFLPEIAERYGERVSPFVRAARDNHSAGVMPGPVEPLR
jgi:D-alanine-D-alanine ligase